MDSRPFRLTLIYSTRVAFIFMTFNKAMPFSEDPNIFSLNFDFSNPNRLRNSTNFDASKAPLINFVCQ
jgi:hypothetical protein